MNHIEHYTNPFTSLEDISFCPKNYSLMKFGDDAAARSFGKELAISFFHEHSDILLAEDCVVIPSPYNFVKNAATIITDHFVRELNELLYTYGKSLEYSIIHRKVSYTADYGFLPKEKRKSLLSNDLFYVNKDFLKGKTIIFLDDVKITGTHEDKLREILYKKKLNDKNHFFLYCAKYYGEHADIESKINFAGIKTYAEYLQVINKKENHIIIRSIKYLLAQEETQFNKLLKLIERNKLLEIYQGALAEGYYKIPQYQNNFTTLRNYIYS